LQAMPLARNNSRGLDRTCNGLIKVANEFKQQGTTREGFIELHDRFNSENIELQLRLLDR
jgi:hypothetical protein